MNPLKHFKKTLLQRYLIFYLFLLTLPVLAQTQEKPLRVGVAGLTHTHVHWILGREDIGDIDLVGIAEPNRELAQRYADQYGFSMDLVFDTLEEMIFATKPEAVTAFGTIYDHLEVVQTCAPLGVHVMVEKPLAVSLDHAKQMAALAEEHNIHLLTNYETTWYPTNHMAKNFLNHGKIGRLRKIVVRDGHKGPVKIGVNREFLDWLQDPKENGGGAITDFGCYGANLTTWLMNGKRPNTVTAITQQFQPLNNPKVDDEATILLTYDNTQAIIQASWNWPIGRKDMELYGLIGALYADNRNELRLRIAEGYDGYHEEKFTLKERPSPYNDPFAMLAAVVKNKIRLRPYSLTSLENNLVVMEILDAARESAKHGKTIKLRY
ncbi:Gfo/Idh/MocA family protein [Flagellimonas sp.]|uniref:Gfo/Idh/MocA family protein n=1 Tax=Flagellimonas sp. TaxID=2058762 RepID=UPI003B509B04